MAVVRLVGLVVGVAAGLVLGRTGPTGAAAPAIAGAVVIAVLVSELGRPRPERQHGSGAALEVRRVRDYARPAVAWGVVIGGLVLVAELAWLLAAGTWVPRDGVGTAWHSPGTGPASETVELNGMPFRYETLCAEPTEDARFTGRSDTGFYLVSDGDWGMELPSDLVASVCRGWVSGQGWAEGEGVVGAAFGTMATAALALLVAPLVLRATVRAPRAGADEQTRERDERWRRGSAGTVVATAGWIVFVPLAVWNIALLLVEDPASFTGPAEYVRLAMLALLAAAAVIGASAHAVALTRAPDR